MGTVRVVGSKKRYFFGAASGKKVATTTLCVVSCGVKKIWSVNPSAGPTEAQHVYVSGLAKKKVAYAKKHYTGSWYILSAKYGFLAPADVIKESYNVTFSDWRTNPISCDELEMQALAMDLYQHPSIVVIGGSDYAKIIERVFPGKQILLPLKGLSPGYMMQQLDRGISSSNPL